jgi:aminoglycoside phosphotransferase (APT) family kinase protein
MTTNKNLLNILEKYTWLKVSLENIIKINSSNNNQVFNLWNYILKISKKSYNLKNEFTILKKLKWKYFPKWLYYFEYKKKYYLIISKLDWKTLDNYWLVYSIKKQQKILWKVTKNLKIIHSIKKSNFNFYINWEKKQFWDYFEVLDYKLKTTKKRAFQNPFINHNELEKLLKIFYKNKDCFVWEKPVLIHNDLWYMNILVNKDWLTCIIDFEDSCFAPKQVELFRIYRHLIAAKNYLEENPQDYKEIDFLVKFLDFLKENYKELFDYVKEQKLIYDIVSYFSMLSKFEKNWYKHEDVKKFFKFVLLK